MDCLTTRCALAAGGFDIELAVETCQSGPYRSAWIIEHGTVLLLTAAAVCVALSCRDTPSGGGEPIMGALETIQGKHYSITVVRPSAQAPHAQEVSGEIEARIRAFVSSAAAAAEIASRKVRLDVETRAYRSGPFLSYVVKITEDAGGAAAEVSVVGFVYDLRRGRRVTLAEAVARLANRSGASSQSVALVPWTDADRFEDDGDCGSIALDSLDLASVDAFYVTDGHLRILFSASAIAPGGCGVVMASLGSRDVALGR